MGRERQRQTDRKRYTERERDRHRKGTDRDAEKERETQRPGAPGRPSQRRFSAGPEPAASCSLPPSLPPSSCSRVGAGPQKPQLPLPHTRPTDPVAAPPAAPGPRSPQAAGNAFAWPGFRAILCGPRASPLSLSLLVATQRLPSSPSMEGQLCARLRGCPSRTGVGGAEQADQVLQKGKGMELCNSEGKRVS